MRWKRCAKAKITYEKSGLIGPRKVVADHSHRDPSQGAPVPVARRHPLVRLSLDGPMFVISYKKFYSLLCFAGPNSAANEHAPSQNGFEAQCPMLVQVVWLDCGWN
eukprot:SAG31_NODE_4016_length_3662_cov_3.395453_2_plen_106_part_00